jgi:hypothetical protein
MVVPEDASRPIQTSQVPGAVPTDMAARFFVPTGGRFCGVYSKTESVPAVGPLYVLDGLAGASQSW